MMSLIISKYLNKDFMIKNYVALKQSGFDIDHELKNKLFICEIIQNKQLTHLQQLTESDTLLYLSQIMKYGRTDLLDKYIKNHKMFEFFYLHESNFNARLFFRDKIFNWILKNKQHFTRNILEDLPHCDYPMIERKKIDDADDEDLTF